MTTTARLGLALLAVALVLLVTSTSGISTVTGTRTADVETAPDATAYLGIERHDRILTNGRHDDVRLVDLQNNLPAGLTRISVTVTDTDPRPPHRRSTDWPTSLSVGERGTITADVVCGGPGDRTEQWQIDLVAAGPDSRITATRSVAVGCEPPVEPPGPPDGVPGATGPAADAPDAGSAAGGSGGTGTANSDGGADG